MPALASTTTRSVDIEVDPQKRGQCMKKVLRRLVTAAASTAMVVPVVGAVTAATAVTTPAQAADYKVLVVGKTLGFRHSSIDEGTRAVIALGQANGFTVDVFDPQQTAASLPGATKLETSPFTTAANLAQYKTLIFISTVDGTNSQNPATPTLLNPTETAALQGYIHNGGGFVGIHAATDSMHTVPWYGQLTGGGARFISHPAEQSVTVRTEDRSSPLTASFPPLWNVTDELYNFSVNPRPSVHVLQTLAESTYSNTNNRMGDDHPISWCQNFEGGRSYYQGLGHQEAQFADAKFLQGMLKGIQWTAGQIQANCATFAELDALLTSYHSSGQISDSAYNSLHARLTSAEDAYNGGSEKSAISYLNQFVSVAQNQIKGDAADLAARDK